MKTRIKRSRSIKPKLNKTNKRKAYKGKKRITRKMLKPRGRKSRNKKYTGGQLTNTKTKTPVAGHKKSGEGEFGYGFGDESLNDEFGFNPNSKDSKHTPKVTSRSGKSPANIAFIENNGYVKLAISLIGN